MARRYVLLDRDGTIIVEKHYLSDPEGVELIPGAGEALRRLQALGLGLAVVTNQSGIARGYLDRERLDAIHARLESELADHDVRLDGLFHCPHHPDEGCGCRKPEPGLAARAAAELGFEPGQAFVVGDGAGDVGLGRRIGATSLLVRTGYGRQVEARGEPRADYVVNDLAEAGRLIESLLTAGPA